MSGGHQLRMGRFCWKTGEKRHSLSREACVTVGQLTDSPFEVCGNKFTVKAGSVVSLALPFPPGPRSHLGGNPRMWIVGINSDWPLLGDTVKQSTTRELWGFISVLWLTAIPSQAKREGRVWGNYWEWKVERSIGPRSNERARTVAWDQESIRVDERIACMLKVETLWKYSNYENGILLVVFSGHHYSVLNYVHEDSPPRPTVNA